MASTLLSFGIILGSISDPSNGHMCRNLCRRLFEGMTRGGLVGGLAQRYPDL